MLDVKVLENGSAVAVTGFANIITKLDKTAKSKPAAASDQKPKSFTAAVETAKN